MYFFALGNCVHVYTSNIIFGILQAKVISLNHCAKFQKKFEAIPDTWCVFVCVYMCIQSYFRFKYAMLYQLKHGLYIDVFVCEYMYSYRYIDTAIYTISIETWFVCIYTKQEG